MISLDTKIKDIMENPAAKGVIEKFLPGITNNPVIKIAYGMSLRDVSALGQAKKLGLTPEVLKSIENGFKGIK